MSNQVCIIDDDDDVRSVMAYALEFEGIVATAFNSGKEALNYLTNLNELEYPRLIILDFMMPEMDGLEFVEFIKLNYSDSLGKIPIALSSARADLNHHLPEDLLLLTKPIDLELFLSTVRSFLGTQEAGQASILPNR